MLLKQMKMIETSLHENAKIVIAEHGISPTLAAGQPAGQGVTQRDKCQSKYCSTT